MVVRLFSTSFRPTSSKRRSQSMSPRPSLPSAVLSSGGANRMTRGSSLSMSPTPLSNSSRPVSGLKNEKSAASSKLSGRWTDRVSSRANRSEEHTSELQSLMRISYAVFCLKKKKNNINAYDTTQYKVY